MKKWFNKIWWKYIFENNTGIRNIICRIKGHPNGVWWYTANGLEPDMRCKDCDEDLG